MNREQLIEKVRAFYESERVIADDMWSLDSRMAGSIIERHEDFLLDIINELKFEEANTPSDGEREALDRIIGPYFDRAVDYDDGSRDDEGLRDEILAAGFHRTVQGEPSDDEIEAARYRERLGDLEGADDEAMAHTPTSSERLEPQGEPSDVLDLEGLEAKAKAATPGPWMLDGMGEDEPEINYWAHRFVGTAEPNEAGSHEIIATSEDGHGPNAEYIAAADPKTILTMIAALRAAAATEGGER